MEDAAGNSWDWTSSWFDDARTFRVMRGGAWLSQVTSTRCSGRRWAVPEDRNPGAGLRAARSFGS